MAIWRLGFRPLFLLGSLFAVFSIALWALQLQGLLARPWLSGPLAHGHEMLFGFTLAIVVGFLLTAVRNWTGLPTISGVWLALLCLAWLSARVLAVTLPGWPAALADQVFLLGATLALAVPLWRARNRRNLFVVALLLAMAAADLIFHIAASRGDERLGLQSLQLVLDLMLFLISVIAGRIIPMFSNNGVPGTGARNRVWLDRLTLGLMLLLALADLYGIASAWMALLCLLAALCQAARLAGWHGWRTRRVPLVWVLHVAYAWIPLHLLLRAAANLGWLASGEALHALTVGAIGTLILAMITRVARGHTGRPLLADRADLASYLLIIGAAAVRVGLPLLQPAWKWHAVSCAAILWSAGFLLYVWRYATTLWRPRTDGKPG